MTLAPAASGSRVQEQVAARSFIGLMSGTSVDAVDGIVLQFDRNGDATGTLATASLQLPGPLRDDIQALQRPGPDELKRSAQVANQLADLYAQCVAKLLTAAALHARSIDAIGAHGQTVRHAPDQGYTIQLLNGARLAERCGIDVVCDLRSADVAAGGQGAPLLPAFHATVLNGPLRDGHAVLNLGGISNVSLLNADSALIGFDCGPANTLLDQWIDCHLGKRFDEGGSWGASGMVDMALLQQMASEPYFGLPPPKSSGRDLFDLNWLHRQMQAADRARLAAQDVQATLVELCALSIADAIAPYGVQGIVACGGGVHNVHLMDRLRARTGLRVVDSTAYALDPQFVEAAGFAWLAMRRIDLLPGNHPGVTGARGPRVLGALWKSYGR